MEIILVRPPLPLARSPGHPDLLIPLHHNHNKQVRDHHNYDDGDEDDDDVLCDTRAPPRGALLHAAAGRTRGWTRGWI